jgi:hypothetical protein
MSRKPAGSGARTGGTIGTQANATAPPARPSMVPMR